MKKFLSLLTLLLCAVDENCTGEPRRAKIEMTVGDTFTTISVNQR